LPGVLGGHVTCGVGVIVTFSGLYLGSFAAASTGIAEDAVITAAIMSANALFFIFLPLTNLKQ
jgi:hypothetical protein